MPKHINLIGKKFGSLEVLSKVAPPIDTTKYSLHWECRCSCGNLSYPRTNDLTSGKTTHCGCIRGTHNRSHTKEYNSWRHIKSRCINPANRYYPSYGGRGIKMCERWLDSFENFLQDMGYAPEKSKRYSVERKENDGNYEPGNCRWATYVEQANNRRSSRMVTYEGKTMTLAQWCKVFKKVPYGTVLSRIRKQGLAPEEAFADVRYSNAGNGEILVK